jgi:hypothetical protein
VAGLVVLPVRWWNTLVVRMLSSEAIGLSGVLDGWKVEITLSSDMFVLSASDVTTKVYMPPLTPNRVIASCYYLRSSRSALQCIVFPYFQTSLKGTNWELSGCLKPRNRAPLRRVRTRLRPTSPRPSHLPVPTTTTSLPTHQTIRMDKFRRYCLCFLILFGAYCWHLRVDCRRQLPSACPLD